MKKGNVGRENWTSVNIYKLLLVFGFMLTFSQNNAQAVTKDEFSQLLQARSKMFQEGKVSIHVLTYHWENESDYTKFADQLEQLTYASSDQFKAWLDTEKSKTLLKAKKTGDSSRLYYFKGKRDHLIVDLNLDKTDYFYDGKKKELVKMSLMPAGINKTTHYEKSADGEINKEYVERDSRGFMDISTTTKHLSISDLDLASAFSQKLPYNTFTVENNKYIFKNEGNSSINLTLTFDSTLGGAGTHLRMAFKNGAFSRDIISGAFSKINGNNIYLPFFTSSTMFPPAGIAVTNETPILQELYVVDSWEIRPVTEKELAISLAPNTSVYDRTVEPALNYILNSAAGGGK